MLKQAVQKLQSERGASLSMALMLFLVCTVVVSITIAAATATSGRLSQLRSMDKSYYNVTSAAKLVWNELNNSTNTITIQRGCDATGLGGGSYSGFTNWSVVMDNDFGAGVSDLESTLTTNNATLFELATYDLLFSTASSTLSFSTPSRILSANDAYTSIDTTTLEPVSITGSQATYAAFKITAGEGYAPVLVTVKRDTNNVFTFSLAEEGNSSSYTCSLIASASVDDSGCRAKKVGENAYHLTWTTKVTWDADSLKLGGGA